MHGYGVNYNKLRNPPGTKSRVFSCVPALWAFTRTRSHGHGHTDRATGTGGTRTGGKAIFHALCGNCKENLAKSRLKNGNFTLFAKIFA